MIKLLAYVAPAFGGNLVHFFLWLIAIVLLAGLAFYAVNEFITDPMLNKLLRFVIVAAVIIVVVLLILGLAV